MTTPVRPALVKFLPSFFHLLSTFPLPHLLNNPQSRFLTFSVPLLSLPRLLTNSHSFTQGHQTTRFLCCCKSFPLTLSTMSQGWIPPHLRDSMRALELSKKKTYAPSTVVTPTHPSTAKTDTDASIFKRSTTKSKKARSTAPLDHVVRNGCRYQCTYQDCQRLFQKESSLIRHKEEEHWWCSRCDVDNEDEEAYIKHKMASAKHITCRHCDIEFRSEPGLWSHLEQVMLSIVCLIQPLMPPTSRTLSSKTSIAQIATLISPVLDRSPSISRLVNAQAKIESR